MKRITLFALLFGVSAAVSAGVSTASAQEQVRKKSPPYKRQKNVVYAEVHGIGLLMDVFVPRGKSNGLAIIDVISGAYDSNRGKLRDHEKAQFFDIFCHRGYTVFAIRPGSKSKFSLHEMLAHLKTGVRWVKAHAEEYRIDPDRIGLTGASAGGHLASLLAVTAEDGQPVAAKPLKRQSTRVRAVGVFFPPTDFLDYGGIKINFEAPGVAALVGSFLFPMAMEGKSKEDIIDEIRRASPARLVTADAPPFLFIHGDADPLVPLQQSKKMVAALQDAGVSAELIVKKGGMHPWPTIHEEVRLLVDWFDKQLRGKPARSGHSN